VLAYLILKVLLLFFSYRFEGIDGVPYNNLEDITIGPCEPDETFDYQCLYLAGEKKYVTV